MNNLTYEDIRFTEVTEVTEDNYDDNYDDINDDIYNEIDNEYGFFTNEEEGYLIENAFYLIEHHIKKNALVYNDPNYQDIIINNILELLAIQMYAVYDLNEDNTNDTDDIDDLKNHLTSIIKYAFKLFHKHVSPKRSFKRTFIRKNPNIPLIASTIDHLKNKPQPEQKTDEWYKFRYNTLTASNIWKAFGSQSSINQLIYEKCNTFTLNKYSTSMDTPMHWGHKYEPISVMVYEDRYKTKVGEFGCILHDTYDFIAASPDGINILDTSKRYGRMLEIKNIVNREINGIPKLEYWIQMQIQMEVCNLNECDFLETKFVEYSSKEEYDMDGSFNYTEDNKLKGIIMLFNQNDTPLYVYAPLHMSSNEFEKWEEKMMETYSDLVWIQNIYWKLNEISCVLVLRNKLWFSQAIPVLNELWNTIQREKISGHEHRAPKRKINRKHMNEDEPDDIKNKCLINISDLNE